MTEPLAELEELQQLQLTGTLDSLCAACGVLARAAEAAAPDDGGRGWRRRRRLWRDIFAWALPGGREFRSFFEYSACLDGVGAGDGDNGGDGRGDSGAGLPANEAHQIEKDLHRSTNAVPRELRFGQGGDGSAAPLAPGSKSEFVNLRRLRRVLFAYVASTGAAAVPEVGGGGGGHPRGATPQVYKQGMNSIALVLLQALGDDEIASFHFLQAIAERLLPSLFTPLAGELNVGESELCRIFSRVLQCAAPRAAALLARANMPADVVALKFFGTLFTMVGFRASSAGDVQLRCRTLLAALDVCFFAGADGCVLVAAALLRLCEDAMARAAARVGDENLLLEALLEAQSGVLPALEPEALLAAVADAARAARGEAKLLLLRKSHAMEVRRHWQRRQRQQRQQRRQHHRRQPRAQPQQWVDDEQPPSPQKEEEEDAAAAADDGSVASSDASPQEGKGGGGDADDGLALESVSGSEEEDEDAAAVVPDWRASRPSFVDESL